MSYTPTNWVSGDIITSAKLNKLENGVAAAGGLVVNITADETDPDTLVMDVKAGDLYAALEAGRYVSYRSYEEGFGYTNGSANGYLYDETNGYQFSISMNLSGFEFVAQTADDYPSYSNGGGDGPT